MHAYMLKLYERMQPRKTHFVWVTWAFETANLGYADFTGMVEWLLAQGFIDDGIMTLKNFIEDLERTLADPTRAASFAYPRVGPFADTIGELSKWYGVSGKRKAREAERQARLERRIPAKIARSAGANPMPKVGRNDLCRRGSGKKYKKCCLG